MQYVIYVDEILISSFILNACIIIIAAKLMRFNIRLGPTVIVSVIEAINGILGYLYIYKLNNLFHIIFYSINLLFMTSFCLMQDKKFKLTTKLLCIGFCYLILSSLVYLSIEITKGKQVDNFISMILLYFITSIGIFKGIEFLLNIYNLSGNLITIDLLLGNRSIKCIGLIDTCNFLKDPMTNREITICSICVLYKLLPDKMHPLINYYKKTGIFKYSDFLENCKILFYPVSYTCIGSEKSTIPVFQCDYMTINDKNIIFKNVLIGICNHSISGSKNHYDLLLNNKYGGNSND